MNEKKTVSQHQEQIRTAFERHLDLMQRSREQLVPALERAAATLIACLRSGNKILICGNGGSAADAQHIAAELTGRFLRERRGLPAIALTTDTSALTAIGNDFGFATVFSRQVEALASPGDVLLGISTSGNSDNVVKAFQTARECRATTILLSGGSGGRLAELADVSIIVPSEETARIQEMHILMAHILCDLIDREFSAHPGK